METAARRENNAVNRDKYVNKKEKIKEKTDYIDKHVSSLDIFNHQIVCFRDWNSLACVFLGILLKSGFHQLFLMLTGYCSFPGEKPLSVFFVLAIIGKALQGCFKQHKSINVGRMKHY